MDFMRDSRLGGKHAIRQLSPYPRTRQKWLITMTAALVWMASMCSAQICTQSGTLYFQPSTTAIDYTIGAPPKNEPLGLVDSSAGACGPISYTITPPTPFVTVQAVPPTLSVSTMDVALVGPYVVTITAKFTQQPNAIETTTSKNLNMLYPCSTATLTLQWPNGTSYMVGAPALTFPLTTADSSQGACGPIVHELEANAPSFLTIQDQVLQVYTTLNSNAAFYPVHITAKLRDWPLRQASNTLDLTVNPFDCNTATLTGLSLTDAQYTIGATTLNVPLNVQDSFLGQCGPIIFTISPVKPFVQLQTSTAPPMLSVFSTAISDSATWPFTIQASLQNYPGAAPHSKTWVLSIVNTCHTETLAIQSIPPITYTIGSPVLVLPVTLADSSYGACGAINYQFVTMPLDFLTVKDQPPRLELVSPDPMYIGTRTIILKAQFVSSPIVTTQTTFQLTVVAAPFDCTTAVLTLQIPYIPGPTGWVEYTVGTPKTWPLNLVDSSHGACGPIVFELASYVPSFVTIQNQELRSYSTNNADACCKYGEPWQDVHVTVQAKLRDWPLVIAGAGFDMAVRPFDCNTATLTGLALSDAQYTIGATTLDVPLAVQDSFLGQCGPIVFTISPVKPFVQLQTSTAPPMLSVFTTAISDKATWFFTIQASLQNYPGAAPLSKTWVLSIVDSCHTQTLAIQTIPPITYTIGSPVLVLPVTLADSSNGACGAINYRFATMPLAFLTFKDQPPRLELVSPDPMYIGTRTIILQAQFVIQPIVTTQTTFQLTVAAAPPFDCTTAVLTLQISGGASYTVGAPALTMPLTTLDSSQGACGPIVHEFLTTEPSFLTIENETLQVYTTSNSNAGYYQPSIIARLFDWPLNLSSLATLDLTVNAFDCTTAVLTMQIPTVRNGYVDYMVGAPMTVPLNLVDSSQGACGPIEFELQQNQWTPSFVTIQNQELLVYSTNNADAQGISYGVSVTAKLRDWPLVMGYAGCDLTVYPLDCNTATLTGLGLTDATYTIGATTLNVPLAVQDSFLGQCGPIVFTISPVKPFVQLQTSTAPPMLSVFTTAISDKATWPFTIQASLQNYPGAAPHSKTWVLTIVDSCATATLAIQTIPPITYTIGSPVLVLPVTLADSSNGACGAINYRFATMQLAFLTFKDQPPRLELVSPDPMYIGTHTITLKAEFVSSPIVTTQTTFQLTVVASPPFDCTTAVLTLQIPVGASYTVGAPALTMPLTTLDSSLGACGPILHELQTTAPSFVTIQNETLQVYTTSNSNAAFYPVYITAKLRDWPLRSSSTTLDLTINAFDCNLAILAGLTLADVTYAVEAPAMNLPLIFQDSQLNACGPIIFTIQPVLPFVTLHNTSTSSQLAVTTTDPQMAGIWPFTITAVLQNYPTVTAFMTDWFLAIVIDSCATTTLTIQTITPVTYYLGSPRQIVPLALNDSSNGACAPVSFSFGPLSNIGYPIVPPVWLYLRQQPAEVDIFTFSQADIGTYTFVVKAWLSNIPAVTTETTLQIIVTDCNMSALTGLDTTYATYQVGAPPMQFAVPIQDLSAGQCGPIDFNISPVMPFVTLQTLPTQTTMLVFTNDQSQKGTYIFQISATLPYKAITATRIWELTIEWSCVSAAIFIQPVPQVMYLLGNPASIQPVIFMDSSNSQCGPIGLTIVSAHPFIKVAGPTSLEVFTTDLSMIGSYPIDIQAHFINYPAAMTSSVSFPLTIASSQCINSIITFDLGQTQVKATMSIPTLITALPAQDSVGSCGKTNYSFVQAYPWLNITETPSGVQLTINFTSLADAGVYNVMLQVSKEFGSAPFQLEFQVELPYPCETTALTLPYPYLPPLRAFIGHSDKSQWRLDPAIVKSVSSSINPAPGMCGPVTYTFDSNVSSFLWAVVPAGDQFSQPWTITGSFNSALIGTWQFTLTATLQNYPQITSSIPAVLSIEADPCLTTSLYGYPLEDRLVSMWDTNYSFSYQGTVDTRSIEHAIPEFCGPILYTVSPALFQMTSSMTGNTFFYLNQGTPAATYTVVVNAELINYPPPLVASFTSTFNLVIFDDCPARILQPAQSMPVELFYTIGQGLMQVPCSFDTWMNNAVGNPADCGTRVYSIMEQNLFAKIVPVSATTGQWSISISSDSVLDAGVYTLTVMAQLVDYPQMQAYKTLTLHMMSPCMTTTLMPAQIQPMAYQVGQAFVSQTIILQDTIGVVNGDINTCGPRLCKFDQQYSFMSLILPAEQSDLILKVESRDATMVGDFTAFLVCNLQDYPVVAPVVMPFTVTIKPPVMNALPTFSPSLPQSLAIQMTNYTLPWSFNLPKISDLEGELVEMLVDLSAVPGIELVNKAYLKCLDVSSQAGLVKPGQYYLKFVLNDGKGQTIVPLLLLVFPPPIQPVPLEPALMPIPDSTMLNSTMKDPTMSAGTVDTSNTQVNNTTSSTVIDVTTLTLTQNISATSMTLLTSATQISITNITVSDDITAVFNDAVAAEIFLDPEEGLLTKMVESEITDQIDHFLVPFLDSLFEKLGLETTFDQAILRDELPLSSSVKKELEKMPIWATHVDDEVLENIKNNQTAIQEIENLKDTIVTSINDVTMSTLALCDNPNLKEEQKQAIVDIAANNWQKSYRQLAETVVADVVEDRKKPEPHIKAISSEGTMEIGFSSEVFQVPDLKLFSGTMYLDDLIVNADFIESLKSHENENGKLDPIGKDYIDDKIMIAESRNQTSRNQPAGSTGQILMSKDQTSRTQPQKSNNGNHYGQLKEQTTQNQSSKSDNGNHYGQFNDQTTQNQPLSSAFSSKELTGNGALTAKNQASKNQPADSTKATGSVLKNQAPQNQPLSSDSSSKALTAKDQVSSQSQDQEKVTSINGRKLATASSMKPKIPVLQVSVLPGPDSDPSDLGFTWNVTSQADKKMKIQMYFQHPEKVSANRVSIPQV